MTALYTAFTILLGVSWVPNVAVASAQIHALANPASVHCIETGGKSEIRIKSDGSEYGVCVFPDGSICDEWEFFREECAPEDAQKIAQRVDASAMWQPGMGFMQTMRANCTTFTNPEFGRCFAAQMQIYGAPPAAVQFTERLRSRSGGQIGYLRDFRNSGQVDIAYVIYPLRANTNQGWLLVNGEPDFLDVDDQDLLPTNAARQGTPLAVLIQEYPQATLWPGDRSGTRRPATQERPDGGQLFVVDYYVLDGCHACERLGSARFGFRFDRFGRFQGARFLGLTTTANLQ